MSTPDTTPARAAGSRWSTRRWLVVGLVVALLVFWFTMRYAFAIERETTYFGTVNASVDKAFAELQRQSALPADQRSADELATVVGIDIGDVRGSELLRIEVPASNLGGETLYAVVTATSTTDDLAGVLGVEGRYTELLLRGSFTGTSSEQRVCVVRVDAPTKARTTEDLEWGPEVVAQPCTDEELAASGGIAR